VDWVFVDHPSYPRPGGLYADEHGVYGDNQVRTVGQPRTVVSATLSYFEACICSGTVRPMPCLSHSDSASCSK
jgi:hypothetical protein